MIVKGQRKNIAAAVEQSMIDKVDAYARKICSCRSAVVRLAIIEFLRNHNNFRKGKNNQSTHPKQGIYQQGLRSPVRVDTRD